MPPRPHHVDSRLPGQAIPLFIFLALLLSVPAHAQDDRCGVSRDFDGAGFGADQDGNSRGNRRRLTTSETFRGSCAWLWLRTGHDRSLFEQKLWQTAKANYSLGKAREFGSEAMTEQANPFTLAAPPQPNENKLPPVRNKWALVVGISEFRDAGLDLRYTSKDAKDFGAALIDPRVGRFSAVQRPDLADEEVTTRRLKEEFNPLARLGARR